MTHQRKNHRARAGDTVASKEYKRNYGRECAFPFPFHGTIPSGASNTMYKVGRLPNNEVFSRPEFLLNAVLRRFHAGFGAGSVYPQGRRHGFVHVTTPAPPMP